jgi:hypothetical protein
MEDVLKYKVQAAAVLRIVALAEPAKYFKQAEKQ